MIDTDNSVSTNQISLLYVDDEEVLLHLGKRFLERMGEFSVDIVQSAGEVLLPGFLQKYDAIISDYQMPVIDGIEFLKAIREQGNDIPFILFTGRGREEVVIEAINNGADFYLQKGGEPKSQFAELSHKIKQAVARKRAEKSLKDSQKQLADIIDFLPDATFAIDRSGTIIAWNRAIEKMTGYSSSQMLGKGNYEYAATLYGHRHPVLIDLLNESNEVLSRYYTNISRSGNVIQAEAEYVNTQGDLIALFIKACPLYDNEGNITGYIESIRDITEVKKSARKIEENERKYRVLAEYSRDAILIIGFDGTIFYINPAGVRMVEEESADTVLARKNVMTYVHPDFYDLVLHDIEQVRSGNDSYISQYKLITGKNREIWIETQGRKIQMDVADAIYVTFRDITQKKQLEEERDIFLKRLLSQQKFTDALLDALPLPVFWKDKNFRFMGCNQAYCTYMGISKEDLVGKTIDEVWPDHNISLETITHDQELIHNNPVQKYQIKEGVAPMINIMQDHK